MGAPSTPGSFLRSSTHGHVRQLHAVARWFRPRPTARQAIFDEEEGPWISDAEIAETPYTAFASKPKKQQVTAI